MHILERGSINIQAFVALCPEVNRRTLQRDLKGMVEKSLLVERGTSPRIPRSGTGCRKGSYDKL